MFKKNSAMRRNNDSDLSSTNTIQMGTEITGDIACKEDIRIDGKLFGNLKSAGKVVIGEKGLIEGTIDCAHATVFGDIKGTTNVNELLILKSTANLIGDINTNKLEIEPGANFVGNCKMGAVIKGLENNANRKERQERSA